MPIKINNNTIKQVNTTYSPKFFSDILTGTGKNIGFFTEDLNPKKIDPNLNTSSLHVVNKKVTSKNGTEQVRKIPILPLMPSQTYKGIFLEDKNPKLGEIVVSYTTLDIKMALMPSSITLYEQTKHSYDTGITEKIKLKTVNYDFFMFIKSNDTEIYFNTGNVGSLSYHISSRNNASISINTTNPKKDLEEQIKNIELILKNSYKMNIKIDYDALHEYLDNYNLYENVCYMVELWNTKMHKFIESIITTNGTNSRYLFDLRHELKYLMTYNIPLDEYRNIYKILSDNFTPEVLQTLCKENLNLMLSNNLKELENIKGQIQTFKTDTTKPEPQSIKRLSNAQLDAVKSEEPLIMVQAGAGTGKSTLILSRVDYLISQGINPKDITVLSFTNAAADNIKLKNPKINSMTIAKMINEIYETNFPNHKLSSVDTLINSIDIYYPNAHSSSTEGKFKSLLKSIMLNEGSRSFTDISNFIELNYNDVMNILNTVEQTTLELEIIICYLKINTLIEPNTITSKFLIIDEVQDNSIFEFVYTLKYITKHRESLFIVGDCSQTLFEFRASNPRALNMLESSGTFKTYQLKINYRSTQEILDFANIALSKIERNQFANIQLMSSSLKQPTEDDFLNTVSFAYDKILKMNEFPSCLTRALSINIKPYIDKCLNKGEKVTFLAYTRKDIKMIEDILSKLYPNRKSYNLVPKKSYNVTVMSDYIAESWNYVKFMSLTSIASEIYQDIHNRIHKKVKNANSKSAMSNFLLKWYTENAKTINNYGQQVIQGTIKHEVALNMIRENMLNFEINHNAIKQALLSARNQQIKESEEINTADFLLSTIHSAKGLEFDNVVVLYKNENDMPEDKKRMYYVALTRAMKTEFVYAYGSVSTPKIELDYLTVCKTLHATAPSIKSPLNDPNVLKKLK